MVLQSGIALRILPLDVTHQVRVSENRLQALAQMANENGPRLADIFESYRNNEYRDVREQGAPLHDPCAIAAAVWPELFGFERVFVQVETQGQLTMGACVLEREHKTQHVPNAYWARQADDEALFGLFNQAISQLI